MHAKVDDAKMTNYAIKADTFTKTEVSQKITDLVGGAPVLLDTLKELSDALGADHNFSTTMLNKLAGKSNQFSTLAPLLLELDPLDPDLLKVNAEGWPE